MEIKQVLKNIDELLKCALIAILLLSFLINIFVFIINWEAYFFGVKLNGTPAGLYLFLKGISAGLLAFLLIKYRRDTIAVAVIAVFAVLYFGYTFVDSAVTIQTLTDNLYSPLLLVLFIISLVFLIVQILSARFGNGDSDTVTSESISKSKIETTSTATGTKKSDDNTIGQIVILAVAAFAIVFLFGPMVMPLFSMFFSGMPGIDSPSVPVGDSLISKVDANGTTEWQTLVNGQPLANAGYSRSYLEVCPSHDGGFIVAGMFRLSGKAYSGLRVMNLDRNGTLIWDIHRGSSAYSETDLSAIEMLLPTGREYMVIMINGIVIRLDEEGNEVWHRYYSHERILNSISLPDGGYLLIGEANEDGPDGWKKFDGWMLCADQDGNTVWEIKDKDFVNCKRAVVSPERNVLVSCYAVCADPDVPCTNPDESGNVIVALDLQGNYLWKQKFVEKDNGRVYSMKPLDNGTVEVYLRGEGEQKYTLDHEGNIIKEELLPPRPDSFSHQIALYITYETEPLAGNGTQVKVRDGDGSESVFVIDYPINLENVSHIYSVVPTSDGGYLVTSSAER